MLEQQSVPSHLQPTGFMSDSGAALFLVSRGSIFELILKLHHDDLFCVTKH